MFKNIYYKYMAWLFYYIGDLLCRFEYEWCYALYQKCMNLSLSYDELNNFQIWKEPNINKKDL